MSAFSFPLAARAQWGPPRARPDIGRYLLKFAFPVVYAAMIAPLTYQFFERTVTPPDGDGRLFGVVPLAEAHRFALAPFLLGLELVSMRLAVSIWRSPTTARRAALVAVFLALQALPAASIFFDAREHDYRAARDVALQQQQVRPEDEARHQQALATWTTSKDELKAQIAALQQQITTAFSQRENALGRLRAPGTWAERETAQAEVERLAGTVVGLQQRQSGLQASLTALINAPPPSPQPGVVPQPVLAETDIDFIVRTASSANSLLAMGIAAVLVAVVFGAGFAVADSEPVHASAAVSLPLDLGAQLRVCAGLPPERQRTFATHLVSTIRYHLEASRAMRKQATHNATLQLESEGELNELTALAGCREEIRRSGVAPTAREDLEQEVNGLIAGSLPLS